MTDDIARLGIEVDSSEVRKATKDLNRLAEEGKQAEEEVEKLAKAAEKAGKKLGKEIAGFLSVGLLVKNLTSVNKEMESLRASLTTVTGDVEKAGIAFEGLQEFAAETPFSVQELTDTFIKLGSLGLAPTERALKSYGNTAGALSKSLNQVAEAVADATVGEFERLKEFGIKARSEGDNVAFTFAGVTTNVRKNAAEIQEYLIGLGETEFAGGMERQADTLAGAFSNLGDSWDTLLDNLLSEANSARLASWVRSVGEGLDSLSDLIDEDTALEQLADKVEAAQDRLAALQSKTGGFRASLTGVDDVNKEIESQQQLVEDLEKQYRDMQVEVFKSSGAFNDLAESLGKVGDAAPEISKELKKALDDAQKDAQKTAQEFNKLFEELNTPNRDEPVTSIDVNNLQLEADSALRAGDFDVAIDKAKQAFELLEQMKEEGNAASFELEFYGEQLKKIGQEASQGKINDIQLEIDESAAQQTAANAKNIMQAEFDASPLVQIATIQWENSVDSVAGSVSRASEGNNQSSLQPITLQMPSGDEHTVFSEPQSTDSLVRGIQNEASKRGKRT